MSSIALAIEWLIGLVKPLLIWSMLAMVLSVPMGYIEKHLFRKCSTTRKNKARCPLAILFSLILVIGIFVGVAVLVVPELMGTVSVVISSVTGGLDQIAAFESSADLSAFPFAEQLKKLDIDWLAMKAQLEDWIQKISSTLLDSTASALGDWHPL